MTLRIFSMQRSQRKILADFETSLEQFREIATDLDSELIAL
jgi:hypothetical protein